MTRWLHGYRRVAAALREGVAGGEGEATAKSCYDTPMSLPFDGKRLRAYEFEFGAGGQRLGCKFMLDDESIQFISEAEITPEIETLIASLGPQTSGLTNRPPIAISH